MGLVYGTTDKQKKEFQDELYQRILGVWETSATVSYTHLTLPTKRIV